MKLVGVDTDETDVGDDKDSIEGGQPDSIDEYLEKTLDEDAAAAAAAADVKRRLEFESPSAVRVEESDGGSGEGNSAKNAGCARMLCQKLHYVHGGRVHGPRLEFIPHSLAEESLAGFAG